MAKKLQLGYREIEQRLADSFSTNGVNSAEVIIAIRSNQQASVPLGQSAGVQVQRYKNFVRFNLIKEKISNF